MKKSIVPVLVSVLVLVLGAACKSKQPIPTDAGSGIVRATGPVATVEEVEPNDKVEQATPIPIGQGVRGTLARTGKHPDVDCFRINVIEPRGSLRAEVTGIAGIEIGLSVLRMQPRRELAKADRGGLGQGKVIPNVGVTSGDYVIVVRHVSGTAPTPDAPYTLTTQVVPATEGDELEPNDVRADAQEIALGTTVKGYFGQKWDKDWFKLKLPESDGAGGDQTVRIELSGAPGSKSATLEVYDEIEALLKKGRARGAGVLFPNLWVRPGQKLLYVVARGGKVPEIGERYTLQTSLQRMTGNEEREPNDTAPRATPLQAGVPMRGFLAPAGDEDWYALEVPAASLARISVTGIDNVDLVLGLHDASGSHRLSVDEGRVREGEVIPGVAVGPGKVLVRVSAKKASMENVFQAYELLAELRPDTGVEEHEPNNDPAHANPIAIGETREGFLYPRRDVDVYKLDLTGQPGPRAVRFALRGIPKVRPKLELRDATGAPLAQDGPKAPEEGLSFDKELAPAVYYVHVLGGEESNPRDRYELKVTGP